MAVTFAQGAAFGQDAPPAQATADGSAILVERERIVDIRAAGDIAKAVAGRPRSRDPLGVLTSRCA